MLPDEWQREGIIGDKENKAPLKKKESRILQKIYEERMMKLVGGIMVIALIVVAGVLLYVSSTQGQNKSAGETERIYVILEKSDE